MAVQYKHKPQEAVKCHRECHSQSRCPIYKLKQSRRVHCVVFLCQYEYSTVKICVSQLLGEPEKIVGINLTWSSILTKGAKKISCPIIFTPLPQFLEGAWNFSCQPFNFPRFLHFSAISWNFSLPVILCSVIYESKLKNCNSCLTDHKNRYIVQYTNLHTIGCMTNLNSSTSNFGTVIINWHFDVLMWDWNASQSFKRSFCPLSFFLCAKA